MHLQAIAKRKYLIFTEKKSFAERFQKILSSLAAK